MTVRQMTAWGVLLACAIGALGHAANAQEAAPAAQASAPAESAPKFYFGVMGHVGHPGVYEHSSPEPMLTDVLKHAGGLAEGASGEIGIIRNGRDGFQIYVATEHSQTLKPGDVIIASCLRPPQGAQVSLAGGDPAANNPHAEAPGQVQLGFINLLSPEMPAIVKMERSEASLTNILSVLGQPQDVLPTVDVIEPGPTDSSGPKSPESPLPSGTVLVFNPSLTRYDMIPSYAKEGLSTPHRIEDGPAATVPEPTPGQPVSAEVAIAQSNGVELLQGPTDEQIAQGFPAYEEALPGMPAHGHELLAPQIAMNARAAGAEIQTASLPHDTFESSLLVGTPSVEAGSPFQGVVTGLGVCAFLLTIGAFGVRAWMISRDAKTQKKKSPTRSAHGKALTPASQVDALIRDELPITEERVVATASNNLQGRPHAPRKVRADVSHEAPLPHVASAGRTRRMSEKLTAALNFETTTDEPEFSQLGFAAAMGVESSAGGVPRPKMMDRILRKVQTPGIS